MKKHVCITIVALVLSGVLIAALCVSGIIFVPKSRYLDMSLKEADGGLLTAVTYNIRLNVPINAADDDKWTNRRDALVGHIKSIAPDIVAMQEVTVIQRRYLEKNLTGYAWTGRSRELTNAVGEGVYIFYRTDRLELLESDFFWLSETPDKVSKGWGAGSKRVTVRAKFRDKLTGIEFIHYNTHLDNASGQARTEGLKIILSRIEAETLPIFLTGDFNFNENDDNYQVVAAALSDAKYSAPNTMSSGSYHGYGVRDVDGADASPIDFIFSKALGVFSAAEYKVLKEKFDGVYTSDHFAVFASFEIL
ncbi:MAG: endonuclease/exonuclease/phosphatase family protein [Clostridiales bacterium]|jgi:endonuclease/exonuclease/phosphatase family metal-dependent hydrolase|nr:endonuclease/exonuclease/phosphatase family protein [Clostridiales bacterium]